MTSFYFQGLRKCFLEISIRRSLVSAIYQCLQQIPKEDYLSAFRDWVKKVTKMCFSKGGILSRFVIKICLIKRSTEVIRTQWQNFLQDPRMYLSRSRWFFLAFLKRELRLQCQRTKDIFGLIKTLRALAGGTIVSECRLRKCSWTGT